MAINPLLLVSAATGLYFVLNSKKPTSTTSGNGNSGNQTSGNTNPYKDLPKPGEDDYKNLPEYEEKEDEDQDKNEDQDNKEDKEEDVDKEDDAKLPEIEEDDPKNKVPDYNDPKNPIIMGNYYSQWFPENGGEKPGIADSSKIWISDSCQSWAVGKIAIQNGATIAAFLPEKYVFPNSNSEQLISPSQWWSQVGGDLTPMPWYINNRITDLPAQKWAINLINYYSKCKVNFPRREDFKTYSSYAAVTKQFINTSAIGKLWRYLYRQISASMYEMWAQQYPQKAIEEELKHSALISVTKFPKMTINNQTDEAYKIAFFDEDPDPNAPQKLDPKNPNHEDYIWAWKFLKMEVKSYRELIGKYGQPGVI